MNFEFEMSRVDLTKLFQSEDSNSNYVPFFFLNLWLKHKGMKRQ